ncbi:unnamed protein product [Phytophthora fragariaefolia]|uniref:Unnamed protein product n=1 Tax=Phytophthora fragariaefolia TaxID=1490495 RepID=A0A9W6XQG6_9STRA|nr:unnamed protein product [Phytophthora fragariaefolia]
MQTPKTLKGRSARFADFYDAADEAKPGGDDSDGGRDYRDSAEDSAKDVIRRLSLDDADRDRGHYLEVRSHTSLDKLAEFEGKRYLSDDSLQWLKRFIYEMKGIRIPQESWCEPFSLCLGRTTKNWYRQLPKKTQRKWNLLSEVFVDYYCSQFDQLARIPYYSARRKENEPICNFLIRLNGYARTAKIQYEKGGADASDHVEHFLPNCRDNDIMDLLYPMRLDDIERVEKIINTKILGEKRKRQRDRLSGSRSRDSRRVESQRRLESTRLTESSRRERRDDRRDDRRDYRRYDRRTRRDDGRDRRVTVAATADYDDDESGYSREAYTDSEGGSDHDYIDAGLADEKGRGRNAREDSTRSQKNSTRTQRSSARPHDSSTVQWDSANQPADTIRRANRFTDRRDNYGRRGDTRERPQYGPCAACGGQWHSVHFCRKRCKFCMQVHDVGRCELFQRYERLANFVTENVDKSKLPDDLQDLHTPSNLN